MKWLFLLLLVINIGIFTWGYQQEQLATKPHIAAGADIGNMRLISELKSESEQAAKQPASELAQAESTSGSGQMEPSQAQSSDATASKSDLLEEPISLEKSKPDTVAAANIQPPPDIAPDGNLVADSGEEMTSRCGAIGPIVDKQLAQKVLDDLKKLKLESKMEQNSEKHQIGYWVVIPHLADSDKAKEVIEQLAQAGLKDIWHFRGGELENVISLGVFSKKENAENFSREVLAKGFQTEMQPRYLNKKRYMVKFNVTRPKNVTGIMWRMVEKKYSKMPFIEQSCEPIATR